MMIKKTNILSAIISYIFWIFLKNENKDTHIDTETSIPELLYIKLNKENLYNLNHGKWKIFMNYREASESLNNDSYNVALLEVTNKDTAETAARLGVSSTKEIIFYENELISSNFGNRRLKNTVSKMDVYDYLIYYECIKIKHYLNSIKSWKKFIYKLIINSIKTTVVDFILCT